MAVYERSTLLKATPREVYAFHEDPRNISKISPSSLRILSVTCRVPACPGDEFCVRVSQFGVTMEWVGVWEETVPHECLVDGAKKSPFVHWRHQHLFHAAGEDCVLTDRISYELPWGIFGRLLDTTVMKVIFTLMFMARHHATEAFFEKVKKAVGDRGDES